MKSLKIDFEILFFEHIPGLKRDPGPWLTPSEKGASKDYTPANYQII